MLAVAVSLSIFHSSERKQSLFQWLSSRPIWNHREITFSALLKTALQTCTRREARPSLSCVPYFDLLWSQISLVGWMHLATTMIMKPWPWVQSSYNLAAALVPALGSDLVQKIQMRACADRSFDSSGTLAPANVMGPSSNGAIESAPEPGVEQETEEADTSQEIGLIRATPLDVLTYPIYDSLLEKSKRLKFKYGRRRHLKGETSTLNPWTVRPLWSWSLVTNEYRVRASISCWRHHIAISSSICPAM